MGAGAIYPIAESDIRVKDFEIPKHWLRGYGMDAGGGAKPTAAAFGAYDRDTGTLYITSCYRRSVAEVSIHYAGITGHMKWNYPGVGDVAALIMTEHDAEQLIAVYKRMGLDLNLADKSVETGIHETWERMSVGKLKVFASCIAWFEEFRLYQRDSKGRIKKVNDHLMDATRYLVRSGIGRMKAEPIPQDDTGRVVFTDGLGTETLGWLGG